MGAQTDLEGGGGGDAFMLACAQGRSDNVQAWLCRFPSWDLERVTTIGRRTAGSTALLCTAQNADDPRASDVARILVEARANIFAKTDIGTGVLGTACLNDNA